MEPYILPIHFDNFQGKHEISSDSLIVFLDAYKEIAEFYGLTAEIQIGVPEEGGWRAKFIILGAISFIGINPISILLTGKTSEEWAQEGRAFIVQQINTFITTEVSNITNEIPRECIKQKNKIYQQFQKDNCIDTFHLGDFPPIPRNNFQLYIKEIDDEEVEYLGETDITVHSPDWKGRRSWRGKIEVIEDKESAFDFDKDLTGKFWERVKLDTLPLHTTDVMRVQLLRRPSNKVKYLILRVLSYNSEKIDSPVSEADINKMSIVDAKANKSKQADQLELPL
jgi:hypothetical protein